MMKRPSALGSLAVLVLLVASLSARANSLRETPLVRAIQRAQTGVVNIHSEKTAAGDSLFTSGRDRKVSGMGTGVVIDERGYIATNYHVVQGVDSLRCTLVNGSTYAARVVSYDSAKDLAIIKIDATGPLSVMPMGTSSDLMLGEPVVAIGNAFGYEHTVTSGIISALGRDVEVNEKQSYQNLIQTDASINPGNSGGPLLSMDGEVIGINVAIRAGAQRIGFAIPIDDARRSIARLMSIEALDGTTHGLVGRDVKAGPTRKLVVQSAAPGTPAGVAGVQPGDVVLKAGTIDVIDGVDLERACLGRTPGEEIGVVVRRGSSDVTLRMKLAERAPGEVAGVVVMNPRRTRTTPAPSGAGLAWQALGLKLTQVTLGQVSAGGTPYRGGMQVNSVRPGSPAETNGIRPGDILVGLHNWETVNFDNVSYVLNHPEFQRFGPLKFYVIRGGETLYGYMKLAAGE
ncbi:MAG TPA: trypsin-like peptidase domain-containing protein [Planctomycetaceae bacterium]|nr:trypsin-like peptidase domain-containing protein [Planctomycetaceae bacterium]